MVVKETHSYARIGAKSTLPTENLFCFGKPQLNFEITLQVHRLHLSNVCSALLLYHIQN